jgi:4,5-dihydroxyphthalate decarboxylase
MQSGNTHGEPRVIPLTTPVDFGKMLSQLLEEGEIDATICADLPRCLGTAPYVTRLFYDSKGVKKSYFQENSIFPLSIQLSSDDSSATATCGSPQTGTMPGKTLSR